ncbi:hypothetical protein TRUGW13939_08551 [Talaromyces rugulosus]|uniref:Uncharacterized protein n=1 Tax=Talaromyces rugulosus TaxID=121627 RepID=A0A7H8R9K9_TALRU|nr:hypothetical protein TRUGW13939_08551 [Talaromyces rugulosus]
MPAMPLQPFTGSRPNMPKPARQVTNMQC